MLIGVILGPVAAKFLDPERWGSGAPGQEPSITLGVMRVMIGIQQYVDIFILYFPHVNALSHPHDHFGPQMFGADRYSQGNCGISTTRKVPAMAP